jgi:hypothetical protein
MEPFETLNKALHADFCILPVKEDLLPIFGKYVYSKNDLLLTMQRLDVSTQSNCAVRNNLRF